MLCRRIGLFTRALAAIDGSKFKAVNARDRNFTRTKLEKRLAAGGGAHRRLPAGLETADRQDAVLAYNLKRVIAIMGAKPLIAAMQA